MISVLSLDVVVVEAELRSDLLTTARLAARPAREANQRPDSPGAPICEGAEDVLRAIAGFLSKREPAERAFDRGAPDDDYALRRRIEALLSPMPVSRDELARNLGAQPQRSSRR